MAPWASQSVVSGRLDGHLAVAVRPDRDPPANVAALLQPLGFPHRPAGDREGVVSQGLVAQAELLAEAQLEGEGRLTVVGRRLAREAGRERRPRRHRLRRRAGQRFLVARGVLEGHPHLDGFPLICQWAGSSWRSVFALDDVLDDAVAVVFPMGAVD